ncbi:MAG: hypothetical protein GIW97_01835 [Candidatus Eremiobacteraeota bacterium]|nr:hypothetical protein [Candidatus Eremiobacteraeota bacterium]
MVRELREILIDGRKDTGRAAVLNPEIARTGLRREFPKRACRDVDTGLRVALVEPWGAVIPVDVEEGVDLLEFSAGRIPIVIREKPIPGNIAV